MSTISVTNINDGDAVTAASVNNQVNTIVNDYNGNITDANISASAAIGAQKIAGGLSGMFSSATTYVPSWVGITVGNGTVVGKYIQIGKLVYFRVSLVWGSTTTASATNTVSLPVTSVATSGTTGHTIGTVKTFDGASQWEGPLAHGSTTTGILRSYAVSGTGIKDSNITATSPNTWTTNAEFLIAGVYEAA